MADNNGEISNDALYAQLKQSAWHHFVFRRTPATEVGYGRLNCECPNLGKFLESYTADLGDEEADGYDEEEEAKHADESRECSFDDEEYLEDQKPKKSSKANKRMKITKDQAWRDSQDALWIGNLVERPDARIIFQMPYFQTQTVSSGGLTKFRIKVLSEFQKAAKLFGYQEPIFSGSPAGILEDFVTSSPSSLPHGLTNQMDPFTWQHYCMPVNEALCVYWHHCPLPVFNLVPCGHAPGETFQGTATQLCQKKLSETKDDWRHQLAKATYACMMDDYNTQDLESVRQLLMASHPLKLVYVNDAGELRHAKNLEACRATFMNVSDETKYPLNPQAEDFEADEDIECEEENDNEIEAPQRLNIKTTLPSIPELENACPQWIEFISTGGGAKQCLVKCNLCPMQARCERVNKTFDGWQQYVDLQWKHMCNEHGPLGANKASSEVQEWIQTYIWRDADRKKSDLIFGALWKAGFRECGHNEQGNWKNLAGSKQGFYEASNKA